jgi:uncharacterized protein (TIGR00369 family)
MSNTLYESICLGPDESLTPSQALLESARAAEHPTCLMCSPTNPLGVKLKFRVNPDGAVLATFACRDAFQSYPETLHGGVIAALLDAAMTNALFAIGIAAVTAELTVRFLAPVALNKSAVVRASVKKATSHDLYYLISELAQGPQVMAHASAKFIVKGSL